MNKVSKLIVAMCCTFIILGSKSVFATTTSNSGVKGAVFMTSNLVPVAVSMTTYTGVNYSAVNSMVWNVDSISVSAKIPKNLVLYNFSISPKGAKLSNYGKELASTESFSSLGPTISGANDHTGGGIWYTGKQSGRNNSIASGKSMAMDVSKGWVFYSNWVTVSF